MSNVQESSMEYEWMWYYVRKDTENEICNICDEKYDLCHIQCLEQHINEDHSDIPNKSEKRPFSILGNGGVKCNHCSQIYMPSLNPSVEMQNHMTQKHKLNNDIANELKNWVNDQLHSIQKCEACEKFEKLNIFNVIVHLYRIHDVTVPPKFIPTGLKDCTWMWYYLRSDTTNEICNICNKQYNTISHRFNMIRLFLNPSLKTQNHLTKIHKLNDDIANKLKIWVNQQLGIIKKCETCKQFEKFDIFSLMVHLHRMHDVTVPPEFIPTDLKDCMWMWYYLRSNTEKEICNICHDTYINAHHCSISGHFSYSHSKIYMPSMIPGMHTQKHLRNLHELNEDITNEIKIWVNQQLDKIKKCETCEKLDIFNLMGHLYTIHGVIVPSKFIPTDFKDCAWMWYYLRSDTTNEICNICNKQCNTISPRFTVSPLFLNPSLEMQNHLTKIHELNEDIAINSKSG
ncbi:uncharacterized protein LOC114936677 isoform X2 [Nylanderia fulva]|uniref:uncharacterized protein LOC114936677 isoform X2 n=1 Tax=Nylanderia fulva TaxID=613905 RepID=UPI0010FBA5ED|nr:uncharacterized protein LOC114936677 isoform X2 [Nylanderia fulva]